MTYARKQNRLYEGIKPHLDVATLVVVAATFGILLFSKGGANATGTLLLGFVATIGLSAAIAHVLHTGRLRIPRSTAHAFLAGFILFCTASVLWSRDAGLTRLELAQTLPLFAIYLALIVFPVRGDRLPWLSDFVLGLGLLSAAAWFGAKLDPALRAALPGNQNHIGILLSATACTGFTRVLATREPARLNLASLFRFGASVAIAATAVSTGSRGALVALGAGLIVPPLVRRRMGVGGLCAACVALSLAAGAFVEVGDTPDSVRIRLEIWAHALSELAEHPLLGFGWGTYPIVGQSVPLVRWTGGAGFAHSTPVEMLVEVGAVGGLLALLAALGFARSLTRRPSRSHGSAAAPLIACVAALLAPSVFEFHLYLPVNALLLVVASVGAMHALCAGDIRRLQTFHLPAQARSGLVAACGVASLLLIAGGLADFVSTRGLKRASAAADTGDFETARRELDRARPYALRGSEYDEHLGRMYLAERRLGGADRTREALAAFESAVNASPGLASAWTGLADARRLLGDIEGRAEALLRAAQLGGGTHLRRWTQLAAARVGMGDTEGAVAACRHINVSSGRVSHRCLSVLIHAGVPLVALRAAIPDDAERWTEYGIYLKGVPAPSGEIRHAFRRALELRPTFSLPALQLFQIAAEQDAGGEASAVLETTYAAGSRDINLLVALAEVRERQGRLEDAAALAGQVLERVPRRESAHRIRAHWIRNNQGLRAEAAYWQDQVTKRPGWKFAESEAQRAVRVAGVRGGVALDQ